MTTVGVDDPFGASPPTTDDWHADRSNPCTISLTALSISVSFSISVQSSTVSSTIAVSSWIVVFSSIDPIAVFSLRAVRGGRYNFV